MRVAVVYNGEPRTFDQVVENHKKFLDGCEVSSFHSTWKHLNTKEHREMCELSINPKSLSLCDYEASDRPDLVRFEKLLLTHKKNHPIFMFGRIQNMTSKAFNDIYPIMYDFDLVVKLRYDFEFEGRLLDYVPEKKELDGSIFITKKMGGRSHPNNVWDGFAYGSPLMMSWYFDCHRFVPFSLFHKEIAEWKYSPEYILGYYLRHIGAKVYDSQVQPVHKFPDNVEEHRRRRTTQYYVDLLNFHPEFWGQIENDCPSTPHEELIRRLKEKGFDVQ